MTRSVGFLFLLLSLLSTSWLETASAFVITSSQGSGLCQPVRVATNPSMAQDYVVALKMSMEESSNSPSVSSEVSENTTPPKPPVKCPDCDLCDGSGRIEGGIGVILKWWPIKAYRPCPNFIERGGFYQRSGQGLDEIAFGRDSTFDVKK